MALINLVINQRPELSRNDRLRKKGLFEVKMATSEEFFFLTLAEYKQAKDKKAYLGSLQGKQDLFTKGYYDVYHKVYGFMFGPTVTIERETPFTQYVGADDGHEDLCDFIIWHGQTTMQAFLDDPKSAIPLAEKMSKTRGFSGDVNSLKKLVLRLA